MILLQTILALSAPMPSTTPSGAVPAEGQSAMPPVQLVWPQGSVLRVEAAEGELVASFDRPLPPAQIDVFRDMAGEAIGDLRWNDDTLVLRPAPGWTMSWRQAGTTLSVVFAPPVTAAGDDTTAIDATRDAAVAAIEADAAAGYHGAARRGAAALAVRYPDDRAIARLLADTRLADGDVRGAARDYRTLGADDRAARRAMAASGGSAILGITARDGSDLAQFELAARADVPIAPALAAGGGVRHVVSRIDDGARRDATIVDASLAAVMTQTVRIHLIAAAALDDGVTGGGFRMVSGPAESQLRATVLRHMPDYSTPAQVLAGGYLSRATIGITYRLTPGVVLQADAGANRYGLAGMGGGSDTIVATAGADYLIRRQFPALGLTYRYEAEYVQRLLRGTGAAPLLPLATRENHTVQALVSGAVGELQLTGLAGWTVDRFGGDGPTASLGIAAPIGIGWLVEASGGVTSITRPGFSGRQLFARAHVTHSLGDGE
ncbi:hypothetical protein [uncultured Sphingomonas sp.]|uniref:hypothetical protein n=1 Tax=uncultured Sphingomonas sp. TaxID=158754 RepID=UPI00260E3DC6|nr:hypothetical protein [uncultured Sphingomonas sp.]